MDIIKIQTWRGLIHQDNCLYNDRDEEETFALFTQVYKPYEFTDKHSYSKYLLDMSKIQSMFVKSLFNFYCNGFRDPVFLKYKDFKYQVHPGTNRLAAIGLREKYDPVSCIIYSEKGKKLLPISGLEVLNKMETIDFDANIWEDNPYLKNEDVSRYQPNRDKHFNEADVFWLEHTNNLYRIYFEDRQLLVFPKLGSLAYNKKVDLNIEDFNGLRNTILHLFEALLNNK